MRITIEPEPTTRRGKTVKGIDALPQSERLAAYKQMLVITIPQAGELLGLRNTKIYELAANGTLPITMITGKRMVIVAELMKRFSSVKVANTRRRETAA
ncbi:hypothetical protein [Armatimonas sp.]|uniref:hypothetical protein n=1 Tax=Armatimonas sp. TaxID=1872638 RepID=UPI00286A4845|nr:hypothetical protein [Armatimonas sp.]